MAELVSVAEPKGKKVHVYHMWEQRSTMCQQSDGQAALMLMNCWKSEAYINFLCLYYRGCVPQSGGRVSNDIKWQSNTHTHAEIHTAQSCWETVCVVCSCRFTVQHIWLQLLVVIHWTGMRQIIRQREGHADDTVWLMLLSLNWKSGLDEVWSLNVSLQPWNSIHDQNQESGCLSGLRINPKPKASCPASSELICIFPDSVVLYCSIRSWTATAKQLLR